MKIFKKLIRLMMIVFLFVKPVIVVAVDPSYAPSYQLAEEVIIKNGEFNDGLNHWIVSNPGSNNPALVTDESGNHYVMASNGEYPAICSVKTENDLSIHLLCDRRPFVSSNCGIWHA